MNHEIEAWQIAIGTFTFISFLYLVSVFFC